jgi:hypothetical protein
VADYQERPNRSRDEFSREFNRTNEAVTLREQLKKWGTPEEKRMIAEIERREAEAKEKKRMLKGDEDRIEIIPQFSKHDLKKDW